MENTIIGVIGAAAGLVGLVMFVRALVFRLGGAEAVGRVLSARQDAKGRYIHRVAYQVGGEEVVSEDSEAYERPLDSGVELPLIYSRREPKRCKSRREVTLGLIGFGLLALMGAVFVLRFLVI
ncbi:MAG: hypothetical protein Q4A05_06445 [Ruminococcus sp.]|nr:hypothetical protein [Ruminococcus sp.]